VSSLGLVPSFSLNEAGQVLFYAELASGESVLVRADPVPEPAASALGGAALVAVAVLRRLRM
jgi:hypothetical protein